MPRFNQYIRREMRTIINNQKKERDTLLSRPYLTRHTQYDAGELKCSNLTIVTMNEERVIEKNGYKVKVLPIYKF